MCAITAFGELVADLPCMRSFNHMVLPLNVAVDSFNFLDESVKFLLLLLEVSLTGEDACMALTLVFFFLVRRLLDPTIFVPW